METLSRSNSALAAQPGSNDAVSGPQQSLLHQLLDAKPTTLRYTVASASSYSGIYHPNNILYNRPHDMSSRWSGSSQSAQPVGTMQAGAMQQPLVPPTGPMAGPGSSAARPTSTTSSPRRTGIAPTSPAPAGTQPSVGTSSGSSSTKQYIILKLERPCVVRSITFGKYHKPHPCNLRDFKIYGSLSLESLLPSSERAGEGKGTPAAKRLIRGGLRNDAVAEKFELRWLEDAGAGSGSGSGSGSGGGSVPSLAPGEGELDWRSVTQALAANGNAIPFALQYIKIVPLAAHTPNYNFSVWHVALGGVSDPALVSRVMSSYAEYRETSTIRLMLKHLREQGHHTAFAALLQSSRLSTAHGGEVAASHASKRPFEHPVLTNLFDSLVRHGTWDDVEACLEKAAYGDTGPSVQSLSGSATWDSTCRQSMFSSYIAKQMPRADWLRLMPSDADVGGQQPGQEGAAPSRGPAIAPSGRGGHSMVFDAEKGIAYLFGGWDGFQDLCDLWAFHVHENRWRLISHDVRLQGGPGPRSCHKMCLDEKSGSIYLLGRYIDYESGVQRQREAPTFAGSPSSAVRSTRASFLPPAPSQLPPSRDVAMGQDDPVPQAGDVEGLGPASPAGGQSRHRRLDQLGAEANTHPRSQTPPSASPTGAQSPSRSTRPSGGSRTGSRGGQALCSPPGREPDFYRFSTKWERWERLSSDTYADGGPKLIYDHGLVVDSQSQILYVFGGRIADPDPNRYEFSGMWRYDIIQRVWTFLFDDTTQSGGKIVSRSGPSMLLDPGKPGSSGMSASQNRQIWILGGHRGASATNLADMWTYNIASGAVREISNNTGQNGPESGFTQRATIDPAAREISLFVGLIGGRNDRKKTSAFWVYSIPWGTWKQVYRYEAHNDAGRSLELGAAAAAAFGEGEQRAGGGFGDASQGDPDGDGDEPPESGPLNALPVYDDDLDGEDEDMAIEGPADSWTPYTATTVLGPQRGDLSSGGQTPTTAPAAQRSHLRGFSGAGMETEPRPRYAAQLVYDVRRKVYYLHGGNPEDSDNRQLRLDDLWRLTLMRPTPGEVLRRAKFRVRQQRFLEMTRAIAAQEGGCATEGAADSTSFGFEALIYLQSEVGAVVDHSNEAESALFRRLMTRLLNAKSAAAAGTGMVPMVDTDLDANFDAGDGDRTIAGGGFHGIEAGEAATLTSAATPAIDAGNGSSTDRPASITAKRGRDELEPEDEETARSPISAYASSAGDGDSEMLSISQVLPGRARKPATVGGGPTKGANDAASGGAAAVSVSVSEREGRPSSLYAERNELFRALLEYFDPELTQPRAEIGSCIEAALGG